MRMLVHNPRVPMPVAMGLSSWIGCRMVVLVNMSFRSRCSLQLERLVQVLVVMRLG
ncbi:MAG: hypothetical protein J2P48_09075 [Alphaproteobacteria bacterium]|nr:hypothetical protein [Alphaproteobacteria bacterium]